LTLGTIGQGVTPIGGCFFSPFFFGRFSNLQIPKPVQQQQQKKEGLENGVVGDGDCWKINPRKSRHLCGHLCGLFGATNIPH